MATELILNPRLFRRQLILKTVLSEILSLLT